jgi:hypothetical protein
MGLGKNAGKIGLLVAVLGLAAPCRAAHPAEKKQECKVDAEGSPPPSPKKDSKEEKKRLKQEAENGAACDSPTGPGHSAVMGALSAGGGAVSAKKSYTTASGSNGNGAKEERALTSYRRHHSHGWRSYSSSQRALASTITRTADQIRSYTQPRLASPAPAVRAQAREYLARAPEVPPEHAETFEALGMSRNADVLEKGPEYAENLENAADAHEKEADKFDELADQSEAAAAQMERYAKRLDQRSRNIDSIEEQRADGSTDASGAPAAALTGFSPAQQDSVAASADAGKVSRPRSTSPGAVPAPAARGAASPAGITAGSATYGNASGALAQRLRDSLDDPERGAAGEGASAPKSAFDDIFRPRERIGRRDPASAAGAASAAEDRADFSLAGSETDRAVSHLVRDLDDQGSDDAVFGSVDQSIFQRMRNYLTKAQENKKI